MNHLHQIQFSKLSMLLHMLPDSSSQAHPPHLEHDQRIAPPVRIPRHVPLRLRRAQRRLRRRERRRRGRRELQLHLGAAAESHSGAESLRDRDVEGHTCETERRGGKEWNKVESLG